MINPMAHTPPTPGLEDLLKILELLEDPKALKARVGELKKARDEANEAVANIVKAKDIERALAAAERAQEAAERTEKKAVALLEQANGKSKEARERIAQVKAREEKVAAWEREVAAAEARVEEIRRDYEDRRRRLLGLLQ